MRSTARLTGKLDAFMITITIRKVLAANVAFRVGQNMSASRRGLRAWFIASAS
jgi:hypothetical protein